MQFGILLIVLGLGAFLLPLIGLRFRIMDLVEDYQPWASIGITVIGLMIVIAVIVNRKPQNTGDQSVA
ncbi:hypothetical protein N8J89_08465 [Crossiella sp. CA-258035]|uniref:hypothetical protein n=1 Tax=Crossiella sp. CA-258035 TaxID=2981138 RepID=UPI0024BC80B8|nr:hypothetical protein [Crossiella sp. CA-258035]WHT21085.1 hypothetical protein N8J89_08465 [Crossiella sp. CA-258035]